MITFIAFLLTVLGCVNWLTIGLLQYDFIAGLFGYQASMFSRICYIIIGAGCIYLIIRIIVNKGSLKIYEKKKIKTPKIAAEPQPATVEAEKEKDWDKLDKDEKDELIKKLQAENEQDKKSSNSDRITIPRDDEKENKNETSEQESLFDEHFSNR